MEQVHYVALTVLTHSGSDHTSSPTVKARGLGWGEPDAADLGSPSTWGVESTVRAWATVDPVLRGASMLHTGSSEELAETLSEGFGGAVNGVPGDVTLFNAPPLVVDLAAEAAQQNLRVALQSWCPAPPSWAPSWSTVVFPRLGLIDADFNRVAPALTWRRTGWVGALCLPHGVGVRDGAAPVLEVRLLCEEPVVCAG